MADYTRHKAKAKNKIARFGGLASFTKRAASYDPISGIMDETLEEFSVPCVLTRPDKAAIATGSVEYGDAMLLVSAEDMPEEPKIGTIVSMNGHEWRITSFSFVAPDGEPILYKINVKRA